MNTGSIKQVNAAWQNKMNESAKSNAKKAAEAVKDAQTTTAATVEISEEAAEKAKAQAARDELAQMASMMEIYKEQFENALKQGEAAAESAQVMLRCLTIAMRIMFGDKVPPADYRYLAKNNLELYSKAVSMRIEKEDPKKHKRLSEDEENTQETEEASGRRDRTSGETSEASTEAAPAAAESGGEGESTSTEE